MATKIPAPCGPGWTQTYDGFCVSMDSAAQIYAWSDYGGGITGGDPLDVCGQAGWFSRFTWGGKCLLWGEITAPCPPGFVVASDGVCRTPSVVCPSGYEADWTGTCIPIPPPPPPPPPPPEVCPPGYVLGADGVCRPTVVPPPPPDEEDFNLTPILIGGGALLAVGIFAAVILKK